MGMGAEFPSPRGGSLMSSRLLNPLIVFLIIFPTIILAEDDPRFETTKDPPYLLRSSVIGSAGSPGSSTQFNSNGTLGQPTPIGIGAGAAFTVKAGFWYQSVAAISPVDVALPEIPINLLFQNFPNPFNPITTVEYMVARESPVAITVFNLKGERIRSLVHEGKPAGVYRIVWDGTDDVGQMVASGVYFCQLQIGRYKSVKKMLMIK
jgi:hypothetical protein